MILRIIVLILNVISTYWINGIDIWPMSSLWLWPPSGSLDLDYCQDRGGDKKMQQEVRTLRHFKHRSRILSNPDCSLLDGADAPFRCTHRSGQRGFENQDLVVFQHQRKHSRRGSHLSSLHIQPIRRQSSTSVQEACSLELMAVRQIFTTLKAWSSCILADF